jgi:membrane protein YqaA with SNARE-associated domain
VPGLVKDVLALLGVGFVSALVPLVNIEAYLGVRGSVADVAGLWVLAFAAALGQMAGKVIWYYLGANALSWGWVRRKVETPKAQARLERWRTRTQERPVIAALLVFASASTGFPPLAIVAVLVGQLRMSLALFFGIGLVGRWLRFAAVLGGADWVSQLFH